MREAFLKRLFAKVNCGVCGQKYDVSNIKVLDQEDGLWVLSVYCSSCGTQGFAAEACRTSFGVSQSAACCWQQTSAISTQAS